MWQKLFWIDNSSLTYRQRCGHIIFLEHSVYYYNSNKAHKHHFQTLRCSGLLSRILHWQKNKRTSSSPPALQQRFNTGKYIYCVGPGCQRWTMVANTNVDGGRGNAATSIATCQSACESNPQCNGVDWVTNAAQGQQCWMSGSSWSGQTNTGNVAGVNHYDLNRNCGQPGPGNNDGIYLQR